MRGWRCKAQIKGFFVTSFQSSRMPWAVLVYLRPWLWPFLGCLIGWHYVFEQMDQGMHPDAEHVYLPAARALLEDGWVFLASTASYRVVPLGYAWPALWGADPFWIRLANCGLWAGCVFAAWRCATLLGGLRAGMVTVLLLALHPELLKYFPTELTEPIFLFGLFGWLWALAEWLIGRNESRALRVCSVVFLTLTLLSRPVLQLLVPLGLVGAMVLAWYWRKSPQGPQLAAARLCRQMALALALSLVLPAVLVLKNGLLFGLWGLSTGSGTGLYLGMHPLFQGAEPAFLGFDYDVNDFVLRATGNPDHLALAGDRAASAAALAQLSSMSFSEGAVFFTRKLWWWMVHHPAALLAHGNALRKIRLFEWLALATCTLHMIWVLWRHGWVALSHRLPAPYQQPAAGTHRQGAALRQCVVWLLLAVLGSLMLAQLLPILYNSRYSSTLLDPWLILLTGFSVAYLLHPYQISGSSQRTRWHVSLVRRKTGAHQRAGLWPGVLAVPALLVVAVLSFNAIRRYEVVAIDPAHLGAHTPRMEFSANASIAANGMARQPNGMWLMTQSPAALVLSVPAEQIESLKEKPPYNALWEINMAIHTDRPRRCRMADIAYTRPAKVVADHISRLNLNADGQPRLHAIHANADLRPDAAGNLRVAFHCPVGTLIQWNGVRLLESLYTEHAHQQQIRH